MTMALRQAVPPEEIEAHIAQWASANPVLPSVRTVVEEVCGKKGEPRPFELEFPARAVRTAGVPSTVAAE